MFSIIIPVFNKEMYIRETLDSLVNQTFKQFEVIIVNDGSDDKSMEIVSEYNSQLRMKIINQENSGVSSARNVGIKRSSREFLGFLDADDYWEPNFLSEIRKVILNHSACNILSTSYILFNEKEKKHPKFNNIINDGLNIVDDYFKSTLKAQLIMPSTVIIRKSIFDKYGYFIPSLTRGEDLEMWHRIMLKEKLYFINEPLAWHRVDALNSLTKIDFPINKSFSSMVSDLWENNKDIAPNKKSYKTYTNIRKLKKAQYDLRDCKYNDFLNEMKIVPDRYTFKLYIYNWLQFIKKMIS